MLKGIVIIVFSVITIAIGIWDLLGKSKIAYFSEKKS